MKINGSYSDKTHVFNLFSYLLFKKVFNLKFLTQTPFLLKNLLTTKDKNNNIKII